MKMSNSEEYTLDVMLLWLIKHFNNLGYKTKEYSEEFLPARVPLYCIMDGKFNWNKIPGEDDEKLKQFLTKLPDSIWIEHAVIGKSDDGNVITVSSDQNQITISLKDENLIINIDRGKKYKFIVEKERDELRFYDEIVIEITTDRAISKHDFFPNLLIGKKEISEASPVRFYKCYFPNAKIYYAYPDYVEENDEFHEFKNVCKERGIGLLKTSNTVIEEVCESISLFDDICNELYKNNKTRKNIETIIGKHFEEYLDQLVFYPEPEYKRRAIVRRNIEDLRISLLLIKKIHEPKNLIYRKHLKKLSSDYLLKEIRDDFTIASDYVKKLWKEFLGLEYPNPSIQIKFEEIFLKEFSYREHFLHQFQVFLIGSHIIDKLYDSRKKTLEDFSDKYGAPLEIAWLAASTYHDFNYSTQKYQSWLIEYLQEVLRFDNKKVIDELSKLNLDFATVRENYLSTSEKLFSVICEKCQNKSETVKDTINLFLYEKIVTKRNHGLLSGITLLKIYNKTKKGKKQIISYEGIEQAALAIALHDEDIWEFFCGCKGYLLEEKKCDRKCRTNKKCDSWDRNLKKIEILDTINFDHSPLIYLLILCDSVQDEGRVGQESSGIKTSIKDIEMSKKGKISIILNTSDANSHRVKQTEFNRIEQFLDDGKFEIVLEPHKKSYGKEKKLSI